MEGQKQPTQKPKPKDEGCNVKFKRDKLGRVIGFSASGHCTKEHLKLANGSIDDLTGSGD